MTCKVIMTVEEMQSDSGRNKWIDLRKTGIGGSDAGIIVGVNPWKSLFQLWMEKTGQVEFEEERSERSKEYMYWGSAMEELIANRFCELTGKKVRRCGMIRNNERPFMLANIDRLVIGENAILECKTTSSWKAEDWKDDNIPDTYYCQVQHYMAVGGYDKCYIACLIGGNRYVWKEVPRNEEDIEALVAAEEEFWKDFVLTKKLPAVDSTPKCTEALKRFYPGGDTEPHEMSGEFDGLCENILDLKKQISDLETILKEKENKLRLEMENYEFGRTPTYNVWYKVTSRSGYNTKQLLKDYPQLAEKYKTQSQIRALKIKVSKARAEE